MKKVFTLLALALCAVGVKAQTTYSFDTSNITESDLTITNGSFSSNKITADADADKTKVLVVQLKDYPVTFSYPCGEKAKAIFSTGQKYFQADGKNTSINFTGLSVGDVIEVEYCSKNSNPENIAGSFSGLNADDDNVASTSTSNIVKNKFTATATTASIKETNNGYRLYSITITKATGVAAPKITKSTEQVGSINVTMTAEEGATIKYTINGGSEQTYSSALTVNSYAEVTAWAVKGEDESAKVSATYVVMPDLTNGKVWNFARVLDSDWENLAADGDNWTEEINNDNNTVRYNNKNAIEGILIANKQVLKATEGLKFNVSTAKRIRINKTLNKLQLNGSKLPIIIPNLKAGQYVTVIGESASSDETDRYLAATTNIEVITGFASPNAIDFTSIGKVVADGSIEMTTTAGVNIFSIEISNSLPTVSVTVPEDGYCTFTPSSSVSFAQSNIAAYKASISGEDITFTEISEVARGEGVMLYYEGGLTDDVPVCKKSAPDSDNEFVGVLTEIASLLSDDGTYANYILNNGSEGMGFYKANNKKVAAGKAYLRVSSSAAGAKNFFSFSFMESGGTTGINEVQNTKNNGELYNLNGMRLSKPTQKGIYIMNGKKFIVK